MKRLLGAALAALLAVLAIAACSGGNTVTRTVTSTTTVAPTEQQPVPCPPGRSFAGCSTTGLPSTGRLRLAPIKGAEFPDVSSWQGHPGWAQVKAWQQQHGWQPGGVFKIGEYHFDPDAAWNSARLAQLGMWKAGYWFVRATGCSHEAALIHQAAIAWHLSLVALDIEVPEARGYSTCLIPALRPFIAHVIIYTGPGTWPGGTSFSVPLWDAAYNFSGPQFGGLWTGHAIAWQFTDGAFAARTSVPGIGFDDVNVDLAGFAKLAGGQRPRPADPYAVLLTHKWRFVIKAPSPTFGAPHVVVASEHATVSMGYGHGCRRPLRRAVCKSSDYHLRLVRGRLVRVGMREHPHYRLKGQGARQTILAKAERKW